MTTRTLTLTEFLLARIAEDEAAARESYEAVPPAFGAYGRLMLDAIDYLIVDPDRVLAECETKRRIVALHRPARFIDISIGIDSTVCLICHIANEHYPDAEGIPRLMQELHPCDTLRFLALPYADHEHFQEEWRP